MEFRMTILLLFLSLSLGRPVIVNIRKINAFTEESKCLCGPDWRCSQILEIYLEKIITDSTSTFVPRLRKVKTNRKKKTYTSVNHEPKNKFYK